MVMRRWRFEVATVKMKRWNACQTDGVDLNTCPASLTRGPARAARWCLVWVVGFLSYYVHSCWASSFCIVGLSLYSFWASDL